MSACIYIYIHIRRYLSAQVRGQVVGGHTHVYVYVCMYVICMCADMYASDNTWRVRVMMAAMLMQLPAIPSSSCQGIDLDQIQSEGG